MMKTKFHASKFKILLTLTLAITLLSTAWLNTHIQAKADSVSVLVEGYAADSDITSSDGLWYSTYCKGAGYKGQGLLVYLIERDGGGPVAGTQPYAFPCSAEIKTYELHARDKFNKYPEVTTWQPSYIAWKSAAGAAQNGGLIKSSTSSNLESIKAWLTTELPNGAGETTTNGIVMVHNLWPSASQRFVNQEVVLVVEPILGIQFAQIQYTNLKSKIEDATTLTDIKNAIMDFWYITDGYSETTGISTALSQLLSDVMVNVNEGLTKPQQYQYVYVQGIKQDIATRVSGDYIYNTNNPAEVYCGTPKRLLDFYASYTPEISFGMTWTKTQAGVQYYKRAAHQAAYIKKSTKVCEFAIPQTNLWPDNKDVRRLHLDNDIRTKSIGMFAMLAWTTDTTGSSQTTCDEPKQPTPHPAPNESTGSCTIIKSYRTKTATGLLTDPSTHTKDNTSPQILIEDEEEYKVIGWKISNSRNPHIDARYWETTVPGNIYSAGTTPSSVILPDTHKVLYV